MSDGQPPPIRGFATPAEVEHVAGVVAELTTNLLETVLELDRVRDRVGELERRLEASP